jgi:uncharacterized damage-inducible protein DinB
MSTVQSLLPEFDHEMSVTRTMLAAVPNARADWQPHAKSMSLGRLAAHLANLPAWAVAALQQDELDLTAPGVAAQPPFESMAATLERFDALVRTSRTALAGTPDAALLAPWTLKHGGHIVFTMPRGGVFRTWVMSHMIHHRGQLSVYLRLLDVPVPSVYGPTADTAV